MTDKGSSNSKDIIKRLDVVIYLLLKQSQEQDATTRQMIKELNDIGLKDYEIAKIFGKSRSYISSELTLLKRLKTKSSKGGKNGR